ncbi:hypothetical protein JOQ06_012656 [Pogonophryne albipinna]|uniref:THAP-type domain-containing protein n=1 Tax=Pogonophryne albipinna TaxID=1090488 RepID=A0AAD6BHH4_9TELE|nr:hypothetical protein JOQ06_012656 [Pogonophryne albipinna]
MVKARLKADYANDELNISIHSFPTDVKRQRTWEKNVQNTRAKWSVKNPRTTYICSAYFLPDDFEEGPILMVGSGIDVTRKRILKPSAVPTLFPTPSQIRQGTGDFATATPPAKRHRSAYFEKREKTQVLDSLLKPRLTADGASAAHTSTACSDASDDPMQETPGTMTSACQTDPVKEKKKPQRSKGVQTKPREKTTGTPIERKLFQDTGSQCNIIPTPKKESNECGGSYRMETTGLERSLAHLERQGLAVGTMVTDRHRQIAKWLRETYPHIEHLYDIWHVAKGLCQHLTFD